MRTSLAFLAAAALAAAGAPRLARAHGVETEVDQREGAVAVRVRVHGGRPLADAQYAVHSPRGGEAPFAEGRTDRHGWLAFTPDVAGTWEVRVADAGGHGTAVEVNVESVAAATSTATPTSSPTATPASTPSSSPTAGPGQPSNTIELAPQSSGSGSGDAPGGGTGGGRALRVLAGVTAVVVVFRLLLAVQRARRARGG